MNDQLAGQVLEALNDKVDIDYGNMPANSTNYAPSSKNVTNCITEIPQDIKLELNNGTLTLKAGSKIYVPNGPGVFDVRVITQDKINSFSWMTTGTYVLTYFTDSDFTDAADVNACYSGTSFPTPVNLGAVCYRTDENKVYRFDGSNWYNVLALPLGIISSTGSGVTSIDQVFNGFGYIGSTAFALPGVKGLAPYGRNYDGTLKSLEINVKNVLTTTDVSGATGGLWYTLNSNAITRVNFGTFTYDKEKNKYRDNNSGSYNNTFVLIDSSAYRKAGKVEKFNPIMPLSITDRSDTDFIANQAMPSSRYTNLTLPGHGAYITVPADGYVVMEISSGVSGLVIGLRNNTAGDTGMTVYMGASGGRYIVFCPASKGDSVQVYHYNSTPDTFRFVYANGSK